jgi:excisionase family DNA binding protein
LTPASDFVDGQAQQRPKASFERPSSSRFWHGFAVRSAGVDGWEGRHFRGRLAARLDVGGMKRKATEGLAFFTERSLADYLAVSDRTIRNWIRRGELASYKLGAARRIDPADVEDFLARHRDEAA